MKKTIYIILLAFASAALIFNSCSKDEMSQLYKDPSKSTTASVENFLTGILQTSNEVVLPWYWRFFVVEQPTLGLYTQSMGIFTGKDRYLPPAVATNWRWEQYYNGPLTQFRQMEDLYNKLPEASQNDYRIFMLAAKIFFYDQTQQMVDLFGDIPWSEAGKVRQSGDLEASLPKYDNAKEIYEAMLTDLKDIADELNSITVAAFYGGLFQTKDYLNNGDISLWKKYCNSLRLRLLIRGSDVLESSFTGQIATILADPSAYPVVTSNSDDIMLDAGGPDLYATTSSQTGGIREAMETWGQFDLAPYTYLKNMVDNSDPRLPAMFDPNLEGEYIGLNHMEDGTTQNTKVAAGMIARFDTASFTRNDYFPGMVISAAEVSFMIAEAIHRGFASGNAKVAYETGVRQSIEFWYEVNSTGTYRTPLTPPTGDQIDTYLAEPGISWDGNPDKMALIGTQKWLNTGLGQLTQTWSEVRRLNHPVLTFLPDNESSQQLPPMRWLYPTSEKNLNDDNYATVADKDKLDTKIFWDVN